MSQRDPEYDRFGPWVVEIGDEDPVPPLFQPHLTRSETPLLSIKIPRRVTRREAHPGMDLYDYLVSLYEHDLIVLERVQHEVESRTIRYRDVHYLSLREELLRGSVRMGIPGGGYDLAYNAVSGEIMRRLADIIRERYLAEPTSSLVEPEAVETSELSFYFERLLREELENGSGMVPVSAQTDTPLGALEASALRRVLFGVMDKRLLESLHLSDGRELRIIDRGRTYAYRWRPVYGRRETWVPLTNIMGVEWDWGPDDSDSAPVGMTLSTAAGDLPWTFTPNNPTLGHYRRFITAALEVTRR